MPWRQLTIEDIEFAMSACETFVKNHGGDRDSALHAFRDDFYRGKRARRRILDTKTKKTYDSRPLVAYAYTHSPHAQWIRSQNGNPQSIKVGDLRMPPLEPVGQGIFHNGGAYEPRTWLLDKFGDRFILMPPSKKSQARSN